jgi:hypothetical protein
MRGGDAEEPRRSPASAGAIWGDMVPAIVAATRSAVPRRFRWWFRGDTSVTVCLGSGDGDPDREVRECTRRGGDNDAERDRGLDRDPGRECVCDLDLDLDLDRDRDWDRERERDRERRRAW